jgi:hypothetical protein
MTMKIKELVWQDSVSITGYTEAYVVSRVFSIQIKEYEDRPDGYQVRYMKKEDGPKVFVLTGGNGSSLGEFKSLSQAKEFASVKVKQEIF